MWKKKSSTTRHVYNTEKVFLAATQPLNSVYSYFGTMRRGLMADEVEERQKKYGKNEVEHEKKKSAAEMFVMAFINPFVGILTVLMLISLVLDVVLAEPGDKDWTTIIIISTMVLFSAVLRFIQEWKANTASEALLRMVTNKCYVKRCGGEHDGEIDIADLVPGDIVMLSAGDMIPADMRIVEAKDLFVSQSSLTGESEPIEKHAEVHGKKYAKGSVVELDNICYMGSNVVSGSAKGIVFATGNHTYLGTIAKTIAGHRAVTAFDKGISKVSMLLIRFMLIMVPFVFLVNGITKGEWLDAFLFAVSIAVGLTPEMLPMIVTANLSKGAVAMAKKKTIVKDLNAIQNFGAMNVLCTDKTGTLTCDKIVLEKYVKADGSEDDGKRILRHAYFNSFFQTGLKNLMDRAILSHVEELGLENLKDNYMKVDEIPFDFTRRRLSVVVEDRHGKRQIITKGAVEEMLDICSFMEDDGRVLPMSKEQKEKAEKIVDQMNRQGLRVLAVAHKTTPPQPSPQGEGAYESPSSACKSNNYSPSPCGEGRGGVPNFSVADEKEMVLIGFLAFLDPPKPSAESAIRQLHEHGVEVKVVSGDNDAVVETIARQVGIDVSNAVTGAEFEAMSEEEKLRAARECQVFSKIAPLQKREIIKLLQAQGNTVGFLGDGINDASALRQSDIGISVDSAVDIAKESADIILLEKDLMVLEDGVIEGRKTFGNITKYVKMTASSNFGNMFSVLAASAFLPFLPMLPIHLVIQNLLYDISQTTIPFDQMDDEFLKKPRQWDSSDIGRFMIFIGPISSIFDIAIYVLMYFFFQCMVPEDQSLFQSGWFIEGLLSQTLIVHMIRTRKIPFIQSRASWPVMIMTFSIMAIGICVPFTSFGASIGLMPLPWIYFPWLIGILLTYCILTQYIKQWYIRRFNKWL